MTNSTDETLDKPMSGQWRSSPFYVAVGAPALSATLSIFCSAACYRFLPFDAAKEQMTYINTMLLVGGGGGSLTGVYGIVARGLAITKGKIEKQLPPKMPETLNTGTANFQAPAEAQSHGDAQDITPPLLGFDLSQSAPFQGERQNPNIEEVIED